MFIISGVHNHLISGLSDTYSLNHSLPIRSINNTFDESVWLEGVGSNFKHTAVSADGAHDMAYSAYVHRQKRAAGEPRHSADTCREASSELSNLLNVVVAHPATWARYQDRIQALQNITKSADCRAIRQ